MTLLRVDGLSVAFEKDLRQAGGRVVEDVSFDLKAGETLGLVGESGSGKSMICLALLGLLPRGARIDGGSAFFTDPVVDGPAEDLLALPARRLRQIRGQRIAMIFQEPMTAFSPVHSIGGQIREICTVHQGCDRQEAQERTLDMLAKVGLPDPAAIAKSHPFELSGGMRQRAMIAMAMICRPALLLADEPTTALDVTTQAAILKLIHQLQEETGMGLLLVSHDVGVVISLADRAAVMHRGHLMERGPAPVVFRQPGHAYTRMLMGAVPRLSDRRAEPPRANTPPLVSVEALSVCYGAERKMPSWFRRYRRKDDAPVADETLAVRSVSLDIRRGECLGLVGESGSGKSSLARAIMGAVSPVEGRFTFRPEGEAPCEPAMLRGKALKAFRKRIHYVFQDPASALNPRHTVRDILGEPLRIHGLASGDDCDGRIGKVLDLVDLPRGCVDRYPHAFSGGQRQRIGIARALMTEPDLILLDEPTSALDVSVQAQILDLLRELQARLGLTFLFISHNLAVIQSMADRIAVMSRGRIVELARRDTVFTDARHPYTNALLAAVPDIDCPLDLSAPDLGQTIGPEDWPTPFGLKPHDEPSWCEVGPDHWVLQNAPSTTEPS